MINRLSKSNQVLITGGAGFIGSHLVERLLADGHEVTVIDDCSTGRMENLAGARENRSLKVVQAKVSQYSGLDELVAGTGAIYHLAAVVGVELVMKSCINTIETNLVETQAILTAASRHRVPVLLTSTSEVYGKSQKPGFSEEDDLLIGPPNLSRWSYACSKLMDEFLTLAYGKEHSLPVVVARLFNTVGPRQTGQYGMVLPRFVAAAKAGEPLRIYGDGRQTRCFCYVQDTVEALVRLQNSDAARGEVYNVGSSEEVTIIELAEEVIRILKSRSTLEFVPYEKAYISGFEDMLRRRPILDKLARAVNFRPATSLREIIELTAADL